MPGKRHIDEPLAPPKPHTDFSNEKSLQKEPETKKAKKKKVIKGERILNSKLFKILFVCAVLIITIKSAWPVTVL